jgi:hypothetical protein
MKIIKKLKKVKNFLTDKEFANAKNLSNAERLKSPVRTEIINFLLTLTDCNNYLEIGVRDPRNNFDKINCPNKYSVDPELEFKSNQVDFKYTSDEFFSKLKSNELKKIDNSIKFDVVFIDGLHLSTQVEKDIINSMCYLKENGFIVLHDCNPPTIHHQREDYQFINSPAGILWNGTTWKAFYKFRHHKDFNSICFDTDWGVGVLTKRDVLSFNKLSETIDNNYYEYSILDEKRKQHLNLVDFNYWKKELINLNS